MKLFLAIAVQLLGLAVEESLPPFSCEALRPPMNVSQVELYSPFFSGLVDSNARVAHDTLSFEALIAVGAVRGSGADPTELLLGFNGIANRSSNPAVGLDDVVAAWRTAWSSLGHRLRKASRSAVSPVSKIRLNLRAATYLQLAQRFDNHTSPEALQLFHDAFASFDAAVLSVSAEDAGILPCSAASIPYVTDGNVSSRLSGYLCPRAASTCRALVYAVNGYDGTNLNSYHEVAVPASAAGICTLIFDGPGQGSAARSGLRFTPHWGAVVAAAASWVAKVAGPPYASAPPVLWGRSFGGHLALAAAVQLLAGSHSAGHGMEATAGHRDVCDGPGCVSSSLRPVAVILDGGMLDAYQSMGCALPASLRALLLSNPAEFDLQMARLRQFVLAVRFFSQYSAIGLGTDTPSAAYAALQAFAVSPTALAGLAGVPVLVNAPALDVLVGNSSGVFWAAYVAATRTSPLSRYLVRPAESGAALHCSVGSTTAADDIAHWVLAAVGQAAALPSPPG